MHMKRHGPRCLLAMAALGLGSAAEAADPFAFDAICDDGGGADTYTVNPAKLSQRLLEEAGVSLSALNLDGVGGVTASEMFSALVYEQYCDAGAVRENGVARPTACPEGQAPKLMQARNLLRAFSSHPRIRFVRLAEASTADPLLQQGLRTEPAWPLLDERRRFVRMECLRADSQTAGGGNDGGGGVTRTSDGRGRLRIAKNPEDLTIPAAANGSLKNVPQAELSYVDDNIANTETFRIHATVGFNVPIGADNRLFPFVQFIRSHVRDTTGANAPQETAKLSVGALSSWRLPGHNVVEIAPLYANDLEDGAEFVSLRVGWRPGFLYRLTSFRRGEFFLCARDHVAPNGRCNYPGPYFAVRTDARVIATAGRVLDVGQNPALVANRDYIRIGGEARVTLFGLRGIVRDFSADISYRHLFGLDGEPNNISAFNAGVNYWIAGSQNASIRYGYERRRDEDTLKRTDQWTVALGLRF